MCQDGGNRLETLVVSSVLLAKMLRTYSRGSGCGSGWQKLQCILVVVRFSSALATVDKEFLNF